MTSSHEILPIVFPDMSSLFSSKLIKIAEHLEGLLIHLEESQNGVLELDMLGYSSEISKLKSDKIQEKISVFAIKILN